MTSSHSQTLVNLHGKGIDEPSEWGHREIDGQAREGNGRDEWERTSQILMRYDPTLAQEPRTFYYQHDHEGSVTHLTDGSGNVIEKYRYDVFGTPTMYDGSGHVLPNGSAFSNRFLFTGREYAATFGFYEYRNRAYHPGLGRFMSEDPKLFVRRIGLQKLTPQSAGFTSSGTAGANESTDEWSFAKHPDEAEINFFRYCSNDPLDLADPMGPVRVGLLGKLPSHRSRGCVRAGDSPARTQYIGRYKERFRNESYGSGSNNRDNTSVWDAKDWDGRKYFVRKPERSITSG